MDDLYFGLALIAALSLAMFFALAAWSKRLSHLGRTVLAAAIVATMGLYVQFVWQSTTLAQWLPVSNLIVVGNWFPLFLAALAGIVLQLAQLALLRRGAIISLLAGFAGYAVLTPLLGSPPECGDRWTTHGDCVQTTDFTCSAASAATLLRAHGIEATEREMAQLCLTRAGTSWLGLYRGLKRKTAGTAWDVEVVHCSVEELPRFADRAMIVEVGLEDGARVDPAFRNEFGWVPGMRHSVVLSGFSGNRAQVVDPSPFVGREQWDRETLDLLWRGHGFRLVERDP